jgi:transposase
VRADDTAYPTDEDHGSGGAGGFSQGIDGLAGVCRQVIACDPFSGQVFVFRNKRKTAIKILIYDGQGFWLCQKRLSKGRFIW